MASEGSEWFVPKRYGWGATPISWQGWAITIGFIVLALAVVLGFRDRPLVEVAILAPATILLLVVTAKTTKGGWRWRWGSDD